MNDLRNLKLQHTWPMLQFLVEWDDDFAYWIVRKSDSDVGDAVLSKDLVMHLQWKILEDERQRLAEAQEEVRRQSRPDDVT